MTYSCSDYVSDVTEAMQAAGFTLPSAADRDNDCLADDAAVVCATIRGANPAGRLELDKAVGEMDRVASNEACSFDPLLDAAQAVCAVYEAFKTGAEVRRATAAADLDASVVLSDFDAILAHAGGDDGIEDCILDAERRVRAALTDREQLRDALECLLSDFDQDYDGPYFSKARAALGIPEGFRVQDWRNAQHGRAKELA